MDQETEGQAERDRRRYQRGLFDSVARQYEATRPGYPAELVEFVARTAGVSAGSAVLEVGCGTGQLTSALLPFGFTLTAIDLGASMIEAARDRVSSGGVVFRAVAFEDLVAAPGSFDLIISATAFHWVDPEVRFTKAARLLRPRGWLAVAGCQERYDEPLGTALARLWRAHVPGDGGWARRPADAAAITASGLFEVPVRRTFTRRAAYPAGNVIGVENTRATSLSWPENVREKFTAELRQLLGDREVPLTIESPVTMARVLGGALPPAPGISPRRCRRYSNCRNRPILEGWRAPLNGEEPLLPGIDVTSPSVARVYDFWLGGTNNFAVDRETGAQLSEFNPSLPRLVRDNRRFLCAAAALAARDGIAQFLDLGAGIPAEPAVHEAVRKENPGARVCYVDNDPAAAAQAKAVLAETGLADGDGVAAVEADLTDPQALLARADVCSVIDFAQPTGIILGSVLQFLPADAAARVCAAYADRAAAGSWLIVSTVHYEDRELAGRVRQAALHDRFFDHDALAVTSWLDGLQVTPPGVCGANQWVAGTGGVPRGRKAYPLAAVAVKKGG